MMEWYCRIEEEEITEMFIIVRAQRVSKDCLQKTKTTTTQRTKQMRDIIT